MVTRTSTGMVLSALSTSVDTSRPIIIDDSAATSTAMMHSASGEPSSTDRVGIRPSNPISVKTTH